MNLQHVISINHRLHEITRAKNNILVLNSGRQRATLFLGTMKLVSKHVLTGKFRSEVVRC